MIPWVHLDTATIPGTTGTLRLMRRGDEFSIMVGRIELMNSRLSGSEVALAQLPAARLTDRPAARLLIGGLGMGFTLRAALGALGPDVRISVAELVPAVIAWGRGPMAALFAGCLDDPRTTVFEADVQELIRNPGAGYDAILLDVDNGPDGLTRASNDALYSAAGLARTYNALRPRGILAVWSSGPDAAFTERLKRARFVIEEVRVRAHRPGKGARHTIWLATRGAAGRPADDSGRRRG